jgi:hypothetical protein
MSLEDKLAIYEVIAQYSHTLDANDMEGFVKLFMETAVMEMFAPGATKPDPRLESRAAIRAWIVERRQGSPTGIQIRHYQSGILFDELTVDVARTRTMLLITRQEPTDAAPQVTRSGVYHDQWRETPEGWRFAQRTLRLDRRL